MYPSNNLLSEQSLNSFDNDSLFEDRFQKTVKGFNRLPQELLLKIFSHLDERDLYNAQQVCQRWKKGALNPSLWDKLKIQGLHTTESVNDALKKIWLFDQLKQVYIKDVLEASVLLRQVYRCLPNLQYLIIRHCSSITPMTMKAVLRKCHLLKMLDLKGTSFKDNAFLEELPKLEHLKILNLSENEHLSIKDFIDISLNCRYLEEFYVSTIKSDTSHKRITDDDCKFIVSTMTRNLKGFCIDGATLTDACFQTILLCDKLQHLGFHRAYNLTGKTVSVIWQYLKNLKTLKLTFGNQIADSDIESLFLRGKMEFCRLEIVDLTGCWKISNNSILAVSQSCPKLRKLIIKCCKKITDIAPLKKCENLEILNVSFCSELLIGPWLPVPTSIRVVFIDKGYNLNELLHSLNTEKRKIKICICHSQYKKSFEIYRPDSSGK
ncbi:hypothetical protein WA026_000966 [Henosepilachna vigintioctopunctata]|uniref:F-box domain-containing protein n=1 Tax=Henosepilachna vigintioctopunctata TaxID=420089 RepID=A0AAW1V093_9CUCU